MPWTNWAGRTRLPQAPDLQFRVAKKTNLLISVDSETFVPTLVDIQRPYRTYKRARQMTLLGKWS